MNTWLQSRIILIVVPLIFFGCEERKSEKLVSIPDPYFLEALIGLGVDENRDGQINLSEAESILSLRLPPGKISDLSGLEAFVNLDTLVVQMNPLSTLDLSTNPSLNYVDCVACELTMISLKNNPELSFLDCSGGAVMTNSLTSLDLSGSPQLETLLCAENSISSLDLSKHKNLKVLNCGRNLIQSLDVSGNQVLIQLICNNNRLTSLDVSHNPDLIKLITCGNQLSKLDISQNTKLELIGVDNMATITEVCVWTSPFPPEGVVVLREFSPNVYFTTNCTH